MHKSLEERVSEYREHFERAFNKAVKLEKDGYDEAAEAWMNAALEWEVTIKYAIGAK